MVSVNGEGESAGNGGGGHGYGMALSLAEKSALSHAKAVLLVDDGEAKIMENGVLGEDGVGADEKIYLASAEE